MLTVQTARISYRGPDRLDVTRATGSDVLGRQFAPSWPLLRWAKSGLRNGRDQQAVWADYCARYTAEMRESYRVDRNAWDTLLAMPRVVLCCYCVNPSACHRVLLAGMLVRLGAVYEGEVGEC